jgi:putative transposase
LSRRAKERLWRSLKYEAAYLHEMTDGFVAERVIGDWLGFYNTERPHSSLGGQTPPKAFVTRRIRSFQRPLGGVMKA